MSTNSREASNHNLVVQMNIISPLVRVISYSDTLKCLVLPIEVLSNQISIKIWLQIEDVPQNLVAWHSAQGMLPWSQKNLVAF